MSRFSVHPWQNSFGRIAFFIGLFAVAALAQNLRFQDVTNSARVSTPNDPNGYGHGVAAGDFNNDGLPDIYVVNYTALNALFLNNGNGTFTEAAVSGNVAHTTTLQDRGVAAADYDDDGDLDLYIASGGYQDNLLFRNNGNGSFSEIANSVGLRNYEMQGESVSWGDYDGDGDLDLFLTSYENPCKLFRQNSDHTFSEVTDASGLGGIAESVQSVFFDLELDGDLDIFISRGENIANSLFVNRGNGVFVDEAASRNITDPAPHGQGVTVSDYDNDGDLDIYMCDDRGPNRLYRNDNGSFDEVAEQAGVDDDSRSLGCLFADFNNDGWPDLYVINFGTNRLYRNNGNGTFDDVTSGSGADNSSRGYGSAVLDYDGDGLLDIYFSNSGQNSNLLRNTTATSHNWLKLALRGVESNRNGIGARVLVTSGGVQQTQQLLAGFAMVSGGSDLTFHFGLGNNSSAARVEVIWPSGERDVLTNVAANQALTIQEGSYGDTPPNDTDPPVISNVASSNVTGSTATITWNTHEAADTQVQYGLTTNYGTTTPLDAARVLNHSVALSGLAQNTTYHFRVLSKDASSNLASSGDFTFTTTNQSVLLADDFSGATLDLNKWTKGSHSGNTSAVQSGTLRLQTSASNASGWVHTKNRFAGSNKTVQVKVVQPNNDGALGMSPTVTTSALTGFFTEPNWYRFYNYRSSNSGSYKLFVQWNKNGTIDGLDVATSVTFTSNFYLRMRTDDVKIYFEYSFNNSTWTTAYSENFALPGYALNDLFSFELSAYNTPAKGVWIVDDFSIIATASVPADTTPPAITNLSATNLTTNSATVAWNTDEASDSQVEYGTSPSLGTFTAINPALLTAHSVNLTGLTAGTTYYYRARSQDAAGNRTTSALTIFTTLAADLTPPSLSNVSATQTQASTAHILWNTNEAATSQVEYGFTSSYGASTTLDPALVTAHDALLLGLQSDTTYHYRVLSRDAAGNLAISGDFTFATPADSSGGTYTLFADDFNGSTLNTTVWQRGTNSGNQTVVANNALELRSNNSQSGWVVTKQSYTARNTTVTVKVVQPNDDGDLGMSPTYTAGAIDGIYNEANWYRFYAYRDAPGNYRLYVLWKKNGAENGLEVTGNLNITAQSGVYLRLRCDDTRIYFEASLDGVNWNSTYNEPFALPGYTLDSNFHYELAASRTPTKGVMIVDDFSIMAPGDTQIPLISNVVAAPASGSATITWNTDEASDSQVEYGTTLAYGSFSPRNGALVTAHSVALSGLSAATNYYYRVRSQDAAGNLALSSGFTFQTASSGGSTIVRTILSDSIKGSTKGTRTGGQFAAEGGWQVTATGDMLVYDLGRYVENGALEIDLSNFRPAVQNNYNRHHFLSMFRNPWGNHHPAENQETVWDLHAGTNYTPGVKLLSWTYNENEEKNTIKPDDFNQAQTYRVRMVWSGNQLQYFLNGALQATHTHSSSMQVRYLYIGRDFTVSGDFITNFNYNQYPALVGPIYANLLVTETLAANDSVPPQITNLALRDLYANAARLTWDTNEATTCYVEYGPTISYGQRTSVLGPPEQTHSTALANLNPNQTYHYRIVAQDDAGNTANSGDGTFTTAAGGVFLFKPIADTFVEQAGLVGKTRDRANFGKMNLLLSAGREVYLRFQVSGLTNAVTQAKLRLHGRQTGAPNATVRALTASWNESTVTWLTKPAQFGNTLGTLTNVTAKQWQEVTLAPFVAANGVYDLALLGAGALVASLDARESTNFQPELIVTTLDTIAPVITNVAVSNVTSSAATITWNTSEASDAQIEYGLTPSYGNLSVLDSNRVTAHAITLQGLAASTTYHYRVRSRDLAGNLALSNDAVFTTLPMAGLPLISNVTATTITSTTAQITFATDRNAYGSVEFDTSAHAATRVMPLGDSITEGVGSSDEAGYRSGLYVLLTDFGSSFDFVGSLQYGVNIPDPDHEGHAGWYANDILAELQNFLRQSQPQAVFLHIGTNDVSLGDHYGTVVNEITAIVDTILQFNPETRVYLSTLIPRRDNKQSVTESVNVNLPEVVTERTSAGYKIFLVDNSAAFLANPNWATEWMADNVHPNDAGYAVMAQQWQKAFINTEYENALSSNSFATAHSLTLTNLTPGNTYHYRARAKDQAGLEAASGDFTFTTPPFTPVTVPLHAIYEITLRAQTSPKNPYVQGPSVAVTFQGASGAALGTTKIVQGFWDGGDTYRVRFAPNKLGDWSWQSSSSDAGLNNQSGTLRCAGTLAAPHISTRGHVRESKSFPYTYAHEDSTPFFLLGDTQWSFATAAISWPTEFQTYVDARAAQGFNYVHGLIYNVYPVGNEANEGGPTFHAANVDSLNPGFWQALDQRVAYMNQKGLVVGLMLAWGNGGWQNFSTVAQVDRFVRYTLARYSVYNVFWITAGEYEEAAPPGGHAHVGELIAASDPYVHPITTHTINSSAEDFGNAAWHTTIYQQTGSPALITRDRIYNKPVINSEFGYEGDQSAEAVRQDAWQIVMRGGFAVYGDTATYHYNATMTSAKLNSPGARFMTILKNFWTGNNAPAFAWQRFTRFEVVSGSRFLAGNPGLEYVVYAEGRGTFTVNLSDASANTNSPLAPLEGGINLANSQSATATIINGQWFNTRTGVWGATFSDTASAAFSLTPPDSAHAAYLVVAPPATPPVISQVLASVTSTTTATITWQTDKPGDSQVEYGLTASYGNVSVLDTTKTLNHQIALTGLSPNTLYHFRARSRDASGALALSGDFTFTTPPNAALLSDNFNTGTLDLTKWQRGSNSENQSAVVNNALELRSQSKQSGWVITKQAFVAHQTTVTVKVTQPNDDGDLGMTPTYNLTSSSGIYGQENWYRFYVYREATSAYHLYVQWLKAGIVGGLDVTGNLIITAQSGVYLRLRMDDANIYFEASLDGQQWTTCYSEVFALPGYTLSDKFYYELAASRTALNGVLRVDDFAIENYTPPSDTLAPVISNVVATNITANAATITWNTNEPGDAQVEYGFTNSYGLLSVRDSSRTTAHTITLTNLMSDTTYHFRVRSQDAAGNLALSSDFTFTTLAAGTSTPLFSDDFNSGTLNPSKWQLGANSGNQSAVSNNALRLQSTGSQSGWVMTKQAYAAGNTTVTVKVTQPNNDGALGMSPTYSLSSSTGFYSQSNWYRFYVYRNQSSGPYLLYVESKKNGVLAGFEVTGNLAINGAVYLRLRFDNTKIYFEASLNGASWTTAHSETFTLPGYSLNSAFYYELAAHKTSTNGTLIVDDFAITTNAATLAKSVSENDLAAALPESFALSQNYPNPFNIETRVNLDLPEHGRVQAVIYNLQGQEVRRLHDEAFPAGAHVLQWNGANARNETVSSGVYILRVTFAGESGKREVVTRRMVVMK